jgi:hypothetical protein
MGASVCLLFIVDITFGYPYGLIMIGMMFLCILAARHVLTHNEVDAPRLIRG